MTTPHVQSFVLISMLRGQPKTAPSGDDLAVLDYHLKCIWFKVRFSAVVCPRVALTYGYQNEIFRLSTDHWPL